MNAKALQLWRVRLLRSVANVRRVNAVDGERLKERVWNGLTNFEAEMQRLPLSAAECNIAAAVLRCAHAQMPHELRQVLGCNDVSRSNLAGQNKETHVSERPVVKC